MNNDKHGRSLDFEKIKQQKRSRRKRRIALIIAGILLIVGLVITVLGMQISQITDTRSFWVNFNTSHAQQSE